RVHLPAGLQGPGGSSYAFGERPRPSGLVAQRVAAARPPAAGHVVAVSAELEAPTTDEGGRLPGGDRLIVSGDVVAGAQQPGAGGAQHVPTPSSRAALRQPSLPLAGCRT